MCHTAAVGKLSVRPQQYGQGVVVPVWVTPERIMLITAQHHVHFESDSKVLATQQIVFAG